MLEDPPLSGALTEVLAFARSGPPVDELVVLFCQRAGALLPGDRVDVRRGGAPGASPTGTRGGPPHVRRFPVSCGRAPWGELSLSRAEGPVPPDDVQRGRLLAEVLGAALVVRSDAKDWTEEDSALAPGAGAGAGEDEMVALVLDCAEDLDRMPDASTRARMALVARRLTLTVGAATWSVGVAHGGRLHDMSHPPASELVGATPRGVVLHHAASSVPLARFPSRFRASEGGAFYADRCTGDEAERGELVARGHSAVVGAGGYDLDGRSWVVMVFADDARRLEHAMPVLTALVLAALSFPREAVVPRPEEDCVRAVLHAGPPRFLEDQSTGFGAAG